MIFRLLFVCCLSLNSIHISLSNAESDCVDAVDDSCDCGAPAVPIGAIIVDQNGAILIDKHNVSETRIYKHGSRIRYRCVDPRDHLVGNDLRSCKRGKWMESVPRCAINYLNETELTFVEILGPKSGSNSSTMRVTNHYNQLGAFAPPLDRQPSDCLKWETSQGQLWILHINQYVSTQFIKMTLYAQNLAQHWRQKLIKIRIQLNNLWGIKCFHLRPYRLNDTVADSQTNESDSKANDNYLTLELLCESHQTPAKAGANRSASSHEVHSIFVTYLSKLNASVYPLSLCDLRLYRFPLDCGSPDFPLSTRVKFADTIESEYMFECRDRDYVVEGKARVKCGANGKWMDDFPVCLPRPYCKLLDSDLVGESVSVNYESIVENVDTNDRIVPNGMLANFSCIKSGENVSISGDYRLRGVSHTICKNGRWNGLTEKPLCYLVTNDSDLNKFNSVTALLLTSSVLAFVVLVIVMVWRSRKSKLKSADTRHASTKSNNEYDDIDNHRESSYPNSPNVNQGYVDFNDLDIYDNGSAEADRSKRNGSRQISGEYVEMNKCDKRLAAKVVNKVNTNNCAVGEKSKNKKPHIYLDIR